MLQAGSKRRRTKKQIELDKQAKLHEEQQIQQKLNEADMLQQKCDQLEQDKKQGEAASSLLSQFMNAGIVVQGDDGAFQIPAID